MNTKRGTRYKDLTSRIDKYYELSFIAERPIMSMDALGMMLGEQISRGASRSVYDFNLIPNTVIKITTDISANILENEVWKAASKSVYGRWFAECLFISPCGHFLIQRKTRKITAKDKLPKTLPGFFTDIKISNWGYIGKQLVCHDYQHIDRSLDHAMACTQKSNFDFENGFM